MNHIISTYSGMTKLDNNLGYTTSHITTNRLTNEVVKATYSYLKTIHDKPQWFYTYQSLLDHINTLKESLVLVDDEQL